MDTNNLQDTPLDNKDEIPPTPNNKSLPYHPEIMEKFTTIELLDQILYWSRTKGKGSNEQIRNYYTSIKDRLSKANSQGETPPPQLINQVTESTTELPSSPDSPPSICSSIDKEPTTPKCREILYRKYREMKDKLQEQSQEFWQLQGKYVEQEKHISSLLLTIKEITQKKPHQESTSRRPNEDSQQDKTASRGEVPNSSQNSPEVQYANKVKITANSINNQQPQDNTHNPNPQGNLNNNHSKPKKKTCNDAIIVQLTSPYHSLAEVKDEISRTLYYNEIPEEDVIVKTLRKDSLILSTKKVKNLQLLYRILNRNNRLNSYTKLKYTGPPERTIIIKDIPNDMEEPKILNNIQLTLKESIEPSYSFFTEGKNKGHYILSIEERVANLLISQGKILIDNSFYSIEKYRPIIRCTNCQAFGHFKSKCPRQETYCGFCAYNHPTSHCPFINSPDKHCCINCLPYDSINCNHSSYSSSCMVFKNYLNHLRSPK